MDEVAHSPRDGVWSGGPWLGEVLVANSLGTGSGQVAHSVGPWLCQSVHGLGSRESMVHWDCCVTLIVMMSFEKVTLTLTFTFAFNALIDLKEEIITLTLTLNVLIGQFNSHMIDPFAYLTVSECLLCNCHVTATVNHGLPSTIRNGQVACIPRSGSTVHSPEENQ